MKEIVERVVSEPGELERAFGLTSAGSIQPVYRSANPTILHVVWTPHMVLYPHDHRMWALIGMYGGQEDNTFYRRRSSGHGLEQINRRSLRDNDMWTMGSNVIHSVPNPLDRFATGFQVHGGDFFGTPRSEWPSESTPEQAFEIQRDNQAFEEANERLRWSDACLTTPAAHWVRYCEGKQQPV